MEAQAAFLSDGRLHLHHGPIDLIVDATGPGRQAGLRRGVERFETVLTELVAELDTLRLPVGQSRVLLGRVACAMHRAAAAHGTVFVTPMAGVAGAVADEILRAICAGTGLHTVHVNNGGDVAFHLTEAHSLTAAIAAVPAPRIRLSANSPVRGMATSGWRGRSHSMGIADSVTVLARTAVQADVAATLIANAVDLPGHRAVTRVPANSLSPDSDLRARLVTVDVGRLTAEETWRALDRGVAFAQGCLARNLIDAAFLCLNGAYRAMGAPELMKYDRKDPIDA